MIKAKAYSRISEIGDKHGVDVTEYLTQLAMNDSVPDSVMKFISEYDKKDGIKSESPLSKEFCETIKSKQLYKTLSTETDPLELAKALSSFITHILIEYKVKPMEINELRSAIDFEMLVDSLLYYLTDLDVNSVHEAASYVLDLLDAN